MKKILLLLLMMLLAASSVFAQNETPTHSPTATPLPVTLHLLVERDWLVIYVATTDPLWLHGLQLRTQARTASIESDFDVLALSEGFAPPGACLVYRLSGSTLPLPSICSQPNRIFQREVPRADVFWYDFVAFQPRAIAVIGDGAPSITGELCPATLPDCLVWWLIPPTPVPTNTQTPTLVQASTLSQTSTATSAIAKVELAIGMPALVQPSNGSPLATNSNPLDIREGPGVAYRRTGTLFAGTIVTIVDGPVVADGYQWWKIERNKIVGWAVDSLEAGPILIPLIPTATAASAVKGYPCEGRVVFYSSVPLNVVRVSPASRSSFRDPIQQGISVTILSKVQETLQDYWYQISDLAGEELGWIPVEHVVPSANCPN